MLFNKKLAVSAFTLPLLLVSCNKILSNNTLCEEKIDWFKCLGDWMCKPMCFGEGMTGSRCSKKLHSDPNSVAVTTVSVCFCMKPCHGEDDPRPKKQPMPRIRGMGMLH
ncbi:hypothetical protein GQ55_8G204000 [Panicum hallii var. hallii]|uniref:Knottin scorpion toxin-like domain-containing protein n=1 Tax=Panicum hallii var. hallii TaxID=1504633 RepID=A0A2T7CPM6_9POAL|nr:hypothetical protein GQ55_8G204000 [Panicum hallii var. hallii]